MKAASNGCEAIRAHDARKEPWCSESAYIHRVLFMCLLNQRTIAQCHVNSLERELEAYCDGPDRLYVIIYTLLEYVLYTRPRQYRNSLDEDGVWYISIIQRLHAHCALSPGRVNVFPPCTWENAIVLDNITIMCERLFALKPAVGIQLARLMVQYGVPLFGPSPVSWMSESRRRRRFRAAMKVADELDWKDRTRPC